MKTYSILLILIIALNVPAEEKQAAKKETTLRFEGDVIEGERKRPDLFLNLSADDLNLDDIIYMRENFNDFHMLDKKKRPEFVK